MNLFIRKIKQPVGFDYLKAFVHHRCGINGNLGPHAPVGVAKRIFDGYVAKLVTGEVPERTTGRR
ncbi:hypothetical protein D3C76_1716410 [compost metagenome]